MGIPTKSSSLNPPAPSITSRTGIQPPKYTTNSSRRHPLCITRMRRVILPNREFILIVAVCEDIRFGHWNAIRALHCGTSSFNYSVRARNSLPSSDTETRTLVVGCGSLIESRLIQLVNCLADSTRSCSSPFVVTVNSN